MRIPRGEEGEGESIEKHHYIPQAEKEDIHETTRSISSPTDRSRACDGRKVGTNRRAC